MRQVLEIAEPCEVAWEQMTGAGAQRHCAHCNKAVHSLSDLDAASAAELLAQPAAAGICVRVRCDNEGVVLHETRTQPRASPRLRLALPPVLLSAGLLASACSTPHRAPAPGQRSHPALTRAGSPDPEVRPAVHELMGKVVRRAPPKPEPPPDPCPGRDCDVPSEP